MGAKSFNLTGVQDSCGDLHELLGIKQYNTTSYHPQANGLVKRFHRQLNTSFMARLTHLTWMTELPIVRLGIRSSWRTELDCSPADLTLGSSLRLPGELISDSSSLAPSTSNVNALQLKTRKFLYKCLIILFRVLTYHQISKRLNSFMYDTIHTVLLSRVLYLD